MKRRHCVWALLFVAAARPTQTFVAIRHQQNNQRKKEPSARHQRIDAIRLAPSAGSHYLTRLWLSDETEPKGGTARFTAMEKVGDATNAVDFILSLIVSDVGSIVLGLLGLLICVGHRLASLDVLSADTLGQETRSDLLAVFASGAILLNGISKLDVTSVLAESVQLDGVQLTEPVFAEMAVKADQQSEVTWALESILAATPASTAVLLIDSPDDGWTIAARMGVLPSDLKRQAELGNGINPILDRFRKDASKETYLPTLQALPGRFEFTYLPPNTQGTLLLPVQPDRASGAALSVLVLGSDTAKSFTPRDVAWCRVVASRIGSLLESKPDTSN